MSVMLVTWVDYTLLQVTALLLVQHIFQDVFRLWVGDSAGEHSKSLYRG